MPNNGFETKVVKDLAKILRDSDLSEIEVDYEGTKIRVARQANVVSHIAAPAVQNYAVAPAAPAPAIEVKSASEAPVSKGHGNNYVKSPMVGTVYIAAEPGSDPFVKVGDTVKEGQQLFIVEAMKTLNAVNSHCSGTIKEILIHDAQPVEYGEHLCIIE